MALLNKQEAICREPGDRPGLEYCHWNQDLFANLQLDCATALVKLDAALATSPELKYRERAAVANAVRTLDPN